MSRCRRRRRRAGDLADRRARYLPCRHSLPVIVPPVTVSVPVLKIPPPLPPRPAVSLPPNPPCPP